MKKTLYVLMAIAALTIGALIVTTWPKKSGSVLAEADGGRIGSVEVITDAATATSAWAAHVLPGQPPQDLGGQVLTIATAAASTGCPPRFTGVHTVGRTSYIGFHMPHDKCKTDLLARTFAITIAKNKLPTGRVSFEIQQGSMPEEFRKPVEVVLPK